MRSLLIVFLLLPSCHRVEPGSCEHWLKQLGGESSELAAVAALAEQQCVEARGPLAERLATTRFPAETLRALRALGPSDDATKAVRAALLTDGGAEEAAATLVAWQVEGLQGDLGAALVAPGLVKRRGALLTTALNAAGAKIEALVPGRVALVAADPGAQGLGVNRRALEALGEAPLARTVGAELSRALLHDAVIADAALATGLRRALSRSGGADVPALVEALGRAAVASPVLCDVLFDAGGRDAAVAIARHVSKVLGRTDQRTPTSLLATAGAAAALWPEAADVLRERWMRGDADALAPVLGGVGGEATREALWTRIAAAKGEARAALAAPLASCLPAAELERFATELEKSPSALVREAAAAPAVAAPIGLLRECGEDASCFVRALDAARGDLAGLGKSLADAQLTLDTKRRAADERLEAATRAYREHPSDDPAEMARLRALRDAEYAPLAPLHERVAGLETTLYRVLTAVRRLDAAPGPAATAAIAAATAASVGLDSVRLWGAVALERAKADDATLARAAGPEPGDEAAVHLRAVRSR